MRELIEVGGDLIVLRSTVLVRKTKSSVPENDVGKSTACMRFISCEISTINSSSGEWVVSVAQFIVMLKSPVMIHKGYFLTRDFTSLSRMHRFCSSM